MVGNELGDAILRIYRENERLRDAAPDLLEAARAATRLLPHRVCERHGITSAIAKATGQ